MKKCIDMLISTLLSMIIYGGIGNVDCRRIVCYFNSTNHLHPEDIDVSLCTNLVYKAAFLDPVKNEIIPWRRDHDLEENGGKGLYKRTVALKIRNPKLKVLLAVGSWNEGSLIYSSMASTGSGRRRFVRSAVEILQQHRFDGMSLDWEYPGRRGGGPEDRRNYDLLISELRIEFDKHGLILSGLLPQSRYWLEGYDMDSVKRNFHYICVNTYNYWGPWWDYTGIAAALKDVESSIKLYLAKRVPRDMIVVGVPAYAQTATLAYIFKNQRPQIIIGPGVEGQRSQTPGRLGYDEVVIMQIASPSAWAVFRDESSQSPYAVKGSLYISYDDPTSIENKAHFIVRNNLGGAMVMSIDSDDFTGISSNVTFPLTRTLYRILSRREEEDEDIKGGPESRTSAPTTALFENENAY